MEKVKNAIILAAGRGSRLEDLTRNTPKPLLSPTGESLIEGIIFNLREKGINEIYIVTGYLHEKFEFLKDYGIKLIYNCDWDKGNNVTSIMAAANHIGNSLIINGDIVMKENVFQKEYTSSLTYVEENMHIDEWIAIFDEKDNVVDFDKNGINKKGFYQREIIFITEDLADSIRKYIGEFDISEYQEFLVIHAATKDNIDFKSFEIQAGSVFDLDTVKEYEAYCKGKLQLFIDGEN